MVAKELGGAAAALDAFRPMLAVSDAEFLRLRYELTTLPARTTRIVTAVAMAVSVPGMDRAAVEKLVADAHVVCPYSNATRGNIDVSFTVV